jgi:WD40 repeat protein
MASERVLPCPKNMQFVPNFPHEQIVWGFLDQSLRLKVDKKVVQVSESIYCLCLGFVDSDSFVTGSDDYMVRQWSITRKDGSTRISQTQLLRGHSGSVLCVAACRSWSIIVSGSEDGTVAIWDLNRSIYVRSIRHEVDSVRGRTAKGGNAVHAVAVQMSTVSTILFIPFIDADNPAIGIHRVLLITSPRTAHCKRTPYRCS